MQESILDILNLVAATTKRNEKESILKKYTNETLKQVFFLAYSPTIKFNLKEVPESVFTGVDYDLGLLDALDLMTEELVIKKVRGHAARDFVLELFKRVSADSEEVIRRILKGDLRCGATDSTANKIWKNLIPEKPCMLSRPYSEKNLKNIILPARADKKCDGSRCISDTPQYDVDDVLMTSRNNKPFYGLTAIENGLARMPRSVVIDGELVCVINGVEQPRTISNGLVNKASNGTISDDEQKTMVYRVWDIVPADVYYGKVPSTMKEEDRRVWLDKVVAEINCPNITVVESEIVNTMDEARAVFRKRVLLGEEGIILKNLHGLWEDTRSKNQVKFKEEFYIDLEIVDMEEGEADKMFEGMLGAFVVRSLPDADGNYVLCNCGIGDIDTNSLTHEMRKYYWDHKDEYLGKIGEFKFNAYVQDKDQTNKKQFALFLPRFCRIRDDKNVANRYGESS